MMRLGFFLLLSLIPGTAVAGEGRAGYAAENRLLEAELRAARGQAIYVVFNLKERVISIKARGMALRKLPVIDSRLWGSPLAAPSYRLRKKSSLFAPGRGIIRPGSRRGELLPEALEMGDMPVRYGMVFEGGVRVSVRPATGGILSAMANLPGETIRFFARPAGMLYSTLRGRPYTSITVILEPGDARALYWSLPEDASVIMYPPGVPGGAPQRQGAR